MNARCALGSAFVLVILTACAGGNMSSSAKATAASMPPLTEEEMKAMTSNTIATDYFPNGDTAEAKMYTDGKLEVTYKGKTGEDSDTGKWMYKGGNELCVTWTKWKGGCWNYFKDGDQIVMREQGGERRTLRKAYRSM